MSPESQAQRDVLAENAAAHEAFERETAERLAGDTNAQATRAAELSTNDQPSNVTAPAPRKSAQTAKTAAKASKSTAKKAGAKKK
jgi:hypothetical protein